MGRLLRKLFNVVGGVVLLYVPLSLVTHFKNVHNERRQAAAAYRPAPPQPQKPRAAANDMLPVKGAMQLLDPPRHGHVRIPRSLDRADYTARGNSTQLYNVGGKPVVCIAYGEDLKAYYANGFLKSFIPYPVDSKWQAMQYIATHLKYMPDEKQFHGHKDIWLTSEETFKTGRGDCEDHAILLADWLQSMGYDARVAFGKMNNGGHAWVVLFEGGHTYLLEATAKYVRKVFPFAASLPQYRPEAMFNDRYIWFNRGSTMTTKYQGRNWVKTARFDPF